MGERVAQSVKGNVVREARSRAPDDHVQPYEGHAPRLFRNARAFNAWTPERAALAR
jgi:hypothetical protein